MRFSFALLLGAIMTALATPAAFAQGATFYTVTYVEVVPASAVQAAGLLKAYRDASRKDAGAVRVDVNQRLDRPNQFTVVGAWADPKAYEANVATAHAKTLNDKLAPMLAAPTDTRQHNALAAADSKSVSGATVTAVTHVDVIPPQKDNGVAAVKQLAEDSRKQTGNVRFDVYQQTNRPNHFTVVETWASRAAYDAHFVQAPTKDFRTKLAAMTGALYDERLYRTLD
jgi:quinol monooxygenase YgiN